MDPLLRVTSGGQADGVARLRDLIGVDVVASLGSHLGEFAVQQPQSGCMDEEGTNGRRNGPQSDLESFEFEVVGGINESSDEQNRPDGNEHVLAEEQSDGVC